jgi:AraC-like DNA-binding protein
MADHRVALVRGAVSRFGRPAAQPPFRGGRPVAAVVRCALPPEREPATSFASALTEAAHRFVDGELDRRTLTPDQVARALNVSPRTLHRAFALQGEPLMAYARRRRLERALADLTRPEPGLTVTEAAARWGFADSSHLTRACRRQYGLTPTQYMRSHPASAILPQS